MWYVTLYVVLFILLWSMQVWLRTSRTERADRWKTFEAIIVRLARVRGMEDNEQGLAFLRDIRKMNMSERYLYIAREGNLPVWVWAEYLPEVIDYHSFRCRKRGRKLQEAVEPAVQILLDRASGYAKEGDLLNAGRMALGVIEGLEPVMYRVRIEPSFYRSLVAQAFRVLLNLQPTKPGDEATLRHLASLAREYQGWTTKWGVQHQQLWKQMMSKYESYLFDKESPLKSQTNKAIPNVTYFAVADDWI